MSPVLLTTRLRVGGTTDKDYHREALDYWLLVGLGSYIQTRYLYPKDDMDGYHAERAALI